MFQLFHWQFNLFYWSLKSMPIQICIFMCFLIEIVPNVSNDDLYPHLQDVTKFRENQRKIFITHAFVQSPDNYRIESIFLCLFHWKMYLTYIMITLNLFFFFFQIVALYIQGHPSWSIPIHRISPSTTKIYSYTSEEGKNNLPTLYTALFQLERRGGTKCHPKSRDP